MRTRRMIVAFVEVETAQDRVWRQMSSEMSVDDIIAEGGRPVRKPFHDGGDTPEGRLRYWCAADKPPTSDTFAVAPVYRTNEVPGDAECEECGIGIRDLQQSLTGALKP